MAKRKFNVSGIEPYTNFTMELLSKYALSEMEREQKKKNILAVIDQLNKGGGLFGKIGTDTNSAYVGGIDLDTGMPQIKFRSPEELQGMQFQSRLGKYLQAKRTGQGMTGEKYRSLNPEQKMQFIKSRETYKAGLPEFGGAKWKRNVKGEYEELTPTKLSIMDTSDLTSEQQLQGRALAKKIYGVRGAEYGLPAVYAEMRKGKSIDQIEDNLRFAGQSKEFTGSLRDAAQTVMMNADADKTQRTMDYMDDLLTKGDVTGVKQQLKRLSRTQAGAEEGRNISGKERTIKLLDEIQGDLNNLEKMGINTNIFTGTAEQAAAKIGTVANPEARKVATKISTAIQNYRRSMTGVQFGMPENKEYKVMFPSIGRTANFNAANINALKEVMQGDLDNFYSLSMGEENYNNLFGGGYRGQQPTGFISPRANVVDKEYQKYLQAIGGR